VPFARFASVRLVVETYAAHGARDGMVGVVLAEHSNGRYDVEFSDAASGATIAQIVAHERELVVPEAWHARLPDAQGFHLLAIVQHFLVQYFGCNRQRASAMIDEWLAAGVWDLDLMFHQSAYLTAAAAYFITELRRPFAELQPWLLEHHRQAPREAVEYAREYFLEKLRPII
jgi:hypothetical protein